MPTNSGGQVKGNQIGWWPPVFESEKIADSDDNWFPTEEKDKKIGDSAQEMDKDKKIAEEKEMGKDKKIADSDEKDSWSREMARVGALFDSAIKDSERAHQEYEDKARARAAKIVDEAIVAKRIADGRFASHPETDVVFESELPLVFKLTKDMHYILAELNPRVHKGFEMSGKYCPAPTRPRTAMQIEYDNDFKPRPGVVVNHVNFDSPELEGKTLEDVFGPNLRDLYASGPSSPPKPPSQLPNGCDLCGKGDHVRPFCPYWIKFPPGAPLPDPKTFHLVCGCGNSFFDGFCNKCKGECDMTVVYNSDDNHCINWDFNKTYDKKNPIPPRPSIAEFRF